MKKSFKNLFIGFGVIILYIFSFSIFYRLTQLIGINYDNLNDLSKEIYEFIYELLLLFSIIFIYKNILINDFNNFYKNLKKYFDEYFKYWMIMLILMFISNFVISIITSNEVAANQQNVVETLIKFPITMFILTAFIAPLLEELVFRLSIRKIFSKSNILYIFFAGFIFGLMHVLSETTLSGFLYIIPYSIPGFIFAYTHVKSNNIFIPISIHFIHNFTLVILQFFIA